MYKKLEEIRKLQKKTQKKKIQKEIARNICGPQQALAYNFHFIRRQFPFCSVVFFIALFFPINCFAARHALLIVTRSLAPWQPLPPSSSKVLKMMWKFDISPNCRLFIWIVKNSCVTGPMRRPRHLAVSFFGWLRYVKHKLFQSQSYHNTVISNTTPCENTDATELSLQ